MTALLHASGCSSEKVRWERGRECGVNCGSTVSNSWERSDLAEEKRLGDGSLDDTTLFYGDKCEKVRWKGGRWAPKSLPAHPRCSHAPFKNSRVLVSALGRAGATLLVHRWNEETGSWTVFHLLPVITGKVAASCYPSGWVDSMQDTLHQAAKEGFGWLSAQRVAAVCVCVFFVHRGSARFSGNS